MSGPGQTHALLSILLKQSSCLIHPTLQLLSRLSEVFTGLASHCLTRTGNYLTLDRDSFFLFFITLVQHKGNQTKNKGRSKRKD